MGFLTWLQNQDFQLYNFPKFRCSFFFTLQVSAPSFRWEKWLHSGGKIVIILFIQSGTAPRREAEADKTQAYQYRWRIFTWDIGKKWFTFAVSIYMHICLYTCARLCKCILINERTITYTCTLFMYAHTLWEYMSYRHPKIPTLALEALWASPMARSSKNLQFQLTRSECAQTLLYLSSIKYWSSPILHSSALQ